MMLNFKLLLRKRTLPDKSLRIITSILIPKHKNSKQRLERKILN